MTNPYYHHKRKEEDKMTLIQFLARFAMIIIFVAAVILAIQHLYNAAVLYQEIQEINNSH